MRGAGHLPDCFFVRGNPDKVVKVDVLRGPRGDGVHAEELAFSFTMGRGSEGQREREREKERERENTTTRLKQAAGEGRNEQKWI